MDPLEVPNLDTNFSSNMIQASLTEACDSIFESFHDTIPFDRIGIALLETSNMEPIVTLKWVRSKEPGQSLSVGYSAPLKGSSLEKVLIGGEPRIINDLKLYFETRPESESTSRILADGIKSNLTCPLKSKKGLVGFIFFSSKEINTYRATHVQTFQLIASQLGLMMEILELNESLSSSKIKETFFYKCNHDLGNMLNVISCYNKLILRGTYGETHEKLNKALRIIDKQVDSAVELFEELMNFGEVLTPDFCLNKSDVELFSYLQQFESIARVLGLEKKIQFKMIRGENLPQTFRMDGKRISQVLGNLVSNAIKFSLAKTSITLHVSCEDDVLKFTIQDQGQGIHQNELGNVFKKPEALTNTPTGHERSHGLGLSICKRIVEDHGGQIFVESIYGTGSSFTFTIPA